MTIRKILRTTALPVALTAVLIAGCKLTQPGARTDQQITSDIQSKIQGESALTGQNIQVSVVGGVATFNGSVTDNASRALAANDGASINGVKTVVNNLVVQPMPAQVPSAQPQAAAAPAPAPIKSAAPKSTPPHSAFTHNAPPMSQPMPSQPMSPQMASAPPPPPPAPEPPKPVIKTITLPAGTVLPVRITEDLTSKTAQPNDVFHGALSGDLSSDGVVAIPNGAAIIGRVTDAKDAAHFAGSALLSLELTEVTARGKKVTLTTEAYSDTGQGRGKNTAVKAGGGGALGAIIGGLAGGGKGAVIGGLAGAAAGTGVNAVTRGQQVTIPSETLINFKLSAPITVSVTVLPNGEIQGDNTPSEPVLQTH